MSWFEHRHNWCAVRVNKVGLLNSDECQGEIILEKCSCGKVRTITVEPGIAPVIRVGIES